jgi:hypothetical protein
MILSKKFHTLEELNKFVDDNKISVINVETFKEGVDSGLPIPGEGNFIYLEDRFKLWFKQDLDINLIPNSTTGKGSIASF